MSIQGDGREERKRENGRGDERGWLEILHAAAGLACMQVMIHPIGGGGNGGNRLVPYPPHLLRISASKKHLVHVELSYVTRGAGGWQNIFQFRTREGASQV